MKSSRMAEGDEHQCLSVNDCQILLLQGMVWRVLYSYNTMEGTLKNCYTSVIVSFGRIPARWKNILVGKISQLWSLTETYGKQGVHLQ
jgi:hypothetical protein